ncbi:unnamed protein product, partial [Symbiodinium sp. KB8]
SCTLADFSPDPSAPADPDSPVAAVEGWAIYAGVAIAFAFLFAVFSVLFCIGRYCCCCIKGGVCGRRHPTLRTHFLGFEPRPPFHYRA